MSKDKGQKDKQRSTKHYTENKRLSKDLDDLPFRNTWVHPRVLVGCVLLDL